MKGRKLLSALIAGTMVLGTMSFPIFAEEDVVATITKSDNLTVQYTSYDGEAGVFANVEEGDTVTFHKEKVECAGREFPSVNNVTYTSDYQYGTLMYHGIGKLPTITGSITFNGLKFDGNAIAIYAKDSKAGLDVKIENCTFNNAGGNCVYIVPEINSLTVTGCAFTSPEGGASTQYLVWPYNAHTINITNNTFTGNGTRGAIHLGNATDTATVSENTINSFERGVQVALSGGGNVSITENEFSDIKKYSDSQGRTAPIFIHKATDQEATTVSVTNNSITNSSAAVFGESGIECINTFTGNTVDSVDAGTLEANSATYAAQIGNTKYVTLADAVAAANAMPGEDNITIEITKTGEYDPFTITRKNVTVEGIVGASAAESTVIKNTNADVVNVYNQNITLKDLWIDDSVGHTSYKSAVNVMGSRDSYYNLTVDNCHFVGNGQVGSIALYYHSPKATITNCTFEDFERGYYGCGDNNAMEKLTVTGNTFNHVKVPVDGYWGSVYTGEEYNIVISGNTFNPGEWGTAYIQLWDYVQYGNYMGWNGCDVGSAIKAKIANNTYNGNVVFYPTHCNVNTVTKIDIDANDKASLGIIPRYFVALPDEVTGADVTYANGDPVDLWNTTMYKKSGNKNVLYTVPTGDFKVTVKKGALSSEESLVVTDPAVGSTLGTVPTVTLSPSAFKAVQIVERNKFFDILSDALSEARDSDTVKVLNDITLTNNIYMTDDKAVTLDLNGKTLSCEGGRIMLNGSDMTVTGDGYIKADLSKGSQSAIEVHDANSTLTVDSVNVNAGANNIIFVANGGEIVINGGTFTAENGGAVILALEETSRVTVKDGIFVGKDGAEYENHGTGAVWGANGAKVDVYGGTFDIADDFSDPGINYTFFDYRGFVGKYVSNISTRVNSKADINVFGGTYSVNPAAINAYLENIHWTTGKVDYVALDYVSTEKDGKYTVGKSEAKIIDTAKTTGATVTLDNLTKNDAIDHEPDATYKVVVETAPTADTAKANEAIAANAADTNTDKAIFDISVVKVDSNGVTTDLGGTTGITDQQVTLTLGDTPVRGSKVFVYHVDEYGNVTTVAVVISDGTNKVTFTAPSFSTYAVTYTATAADPTTITSEVGVVFSPVSEGSNQYYITLKALDAGKKINRFMSADLAFVNNCATVDYEIEAAANMNAAVINENGTTREYRFDMDGLSASCATGEGITIGTITFSGYGTLDFSVNGTYTAGHAVNIVNTAKAANNIVDNYMVSSGTLLVNDAVTGNSQLAADEKGTITDTLVPAKKNLTVNVTFNNEITDNAKAYQDMKAVISGGDLLSDITVNFGTDEKALVGDTYTFTQALTQNIAYTVTISGAGYRTARHTVTMTTDKTLNFWNNVKDTAEEIETGKGAKKANFLAGDIVKDSNINIYDLSAVVSYFGTANLVAEHPEYAKYDLNRDGKIDSKDVAYVLVSWGN